MAWASGNGTISQLGWPVETWTQQMPTASEADMLEFPWQTLEKHTTKQNFLQRWELSKIYAVQYDNF